MSDNERRTFLKKSAAGLLGLTALTHTSCPSSASNKISLPVKPELQHRVVIVTAKNGNREDFHHNPSGRKWCSKLLDSGMAALTDMTAAEGWRFFFPGNLRVGIKINTLAGKGISTSVPLTESLANRIIISAPETNSIIIWDRFSHELKKAGYTISRKTSRQCFGTDEPHVGYEEKLSMNGGVCGHLSRILTELTDVFINMPVLKDHNLAGLSGAMKNNFGLIHNPNKYHDNNCDPFVAELNSLPDIQQKQRLIVADALNVQYNGGPGYQSNYCEFMGTIVMGIDPVAVDSVLLDILDGLRKKHNLPPTSETTHPAKYIVTASKEPYTLGRSEKDQIDIRKVEVG